jgi:hypothetical protein
MLNTATKRGEERHGAFTAVKEVIQECCEAQMFLRWCRDGATEGIDHNTSEAGRGGTQGSAAERKQEPKMSLASEMRALRTQRSREAFGERAAERRSSKAGQTLATRDAWWKSRGAGAEESLS